MAAQMQGQVQRWGVLIGRFQPFHEGHARLVEQVLEECDGLVLLFGSSFSGRSLRNPWTLEEREQMLALAMGSEAMERIHTRGIADVYYSDKDWVELVRTTVEGAVPAGAELCLYGHTKDASSYYLALFPGWSYSELPNHAGLSATPLREALLASRPEAVPELVSGVLKNQIPAGVGRWLSDYAQKPEFSRLLAEADAVQAFQRAWEGSPYPPVFVTVDALVQWRDEILLIRRGQAPGQGLWALPGGFIDPGERLEEACRRELMEETGLNLGAGARPQRCFTADHPDRSDRGRFISHVFHYQLEADQARPSVLGGDDAAAAQWWPMQEIDPRSCFEDHHALLRQFFPELPIPGLVRSA